MSASARIFQTVGATMLAITLSTHGYEASASHGTFGNNLPDRDCTWENANGTWPAQINVRHLGANSTIPTGVTDLTPVNWPGQTTQGGHVYSFQQRMSAAVTHINTQIPNTGAGQQSGFNLVWHAGVWAGNINQTTNVVGVYYNDTGNVNVIVPSEAGRRMAARPGPGGNATCEHGADTGTRILAGWVKMSRYSHWHTAEVRTAWESCPRRTSPGDPTYTYLCSKNHDFQSVFTHEVMHTYGLGHAQFSTAGTGDGHCTTPTRAIAGGNPSVRPTDPAMTCANTNNIYLFTTARRNYSHIHNYDRLAINRQLRDQM